MSGKGLSVSFFLLAAQFTILLYPSAAGGALFLVPQDYGTIQAGLDAASSGDTVLVAAGTYQGAGNWDLGFGGKALVLKSVSGPEATIINCQAAALHRGFHLWGMLEPSGQIDGFTVANARAAGPGYEGGGALLGYTAVTLRNCVFVNCRGNYGGAVYAAGDFAPPTRILGCEFRENIAYNGAIVEGESLELSGCTFSSNDPGDNGVIHSTASLTVVDCSIQGTVGNSYTGGIDAWVGPIHLERTFIAGNRGGMASGLHIKNAQAEVIECTIVDNAGVAILGAGVEIENSTVSFVRSIVRGNCGSEGDPQDIRRPTSASISLQCCAYDPAGIAPGPGAITYLGPQVTTDPLFCEERSCQQVPFTGGTYSLSIGSPCLPENSPCGQLIGSFGLGCDLTSVEPMTAGLGEFRTIRIIPNPAPGACRFEVAPTSTPLALEIFDPAGRLIRKLESANDLFWNGRDAAGQPSPTGIYLVRIRGAGGANAQRLVLLR